MKRYALVLCLLFTGATALESCTSPRSAAMHKKRKQPRRGPIPCPIKDC